MRHWPLIRMDHCPCRSPIKRSSLLPGGLRRSSSERARLIKRSLRTAASCMSCGSRRDLSPDQMRSVSLLAKLRIMAGYTALRYITQGVMEGGVGGPTPLLRNAPPQGLGRGECLGEGGIRRSHPPIPAQRAGHCYEQATFSFQVKTKRLGLAASAFPFLASSSPGCFSADPWPWLCSLPFAPVANATRQAASIVVDRVVSNAPPQGLGRGEGQVRFSARFTPLTTAFKLATTMFLSMPTPKSVLPSASRSSI